jgi:hypothetical protein
VQVSTQSGLKQINLRPEALKLVQERAGNTLEALGIGKDFLSRIQVAQQLRERIDKWDYMKLKSLCTTKGKGMITIIYRELKKLNSKKINDPMKKWVNELNRAFSKEEAQMAKNAHHPWP